MEDVWGGACGQQQAVPREDLAKGVGTTSAFLLRVTGNHNRVLCGDILLRTTLIASWTGGPSWVVCISKVMLSRH